MDKLDLLTSTGIQQPDAELIYVHTHVSNCGDCGVKGIADAKAGQCVNSETMCYGAPCLFVYWP
jgi:hypothetical protein